MTADRLMTGSVGLGLRLSLGAGRAGILRTALMASGAALGALVVLAALAGSAAYGKQYDKDSARTPASSSDSGEPVTWQPGQPVYGIRYDGIGGRPLTRVAVAVGGTGGATGTAPTGPLAPGLTAYPGPGEAVVSPALADLIRTDERARARFPQRVVGLIGEPGLVAPDELYAYVGVPADDPYLVDGMSVTGFRGPAPWTLGASLFDAFTPERMAGVLFALFVLVPFGVFLGVCARLSASTRDRRIAALRLLGVSARQTALVNAVETGVVAGVGALTGYAAFRLLVPFSGGWHLGHLHWYPADLALPLPVVALVLAATVGYAVAVGVLATRPARVAPIRVRRDAPARRPTLWRLVPLAAGVGLTVAALRDAYPDAVPPYLGYAAALVLVGIGVPLTVPLFTWALAGLAARLPGMPVSGELAAARLRHSPGVAPRLVASLAAAVYAAAIGGIGIALLAENVDSVPATAEEAAGARVYETTISGPELAAALERAGGTVSRTAYPPVLLDGADYSMMVADCHSITAVYRLDPGESCMDGEAYRIEEVMDRPGIEVDSEPVEPGIATGAQVSDPGGRWSFAAPAASLHLTMKFGWGRFFGLLVTPAAPVFRGQPPPAERWAEVVVPDAATGERIAQVISATTPGNLLQGNLDYRNGVDPTLVTTLLVTGLAISVGLGVAAFAVAAIDRTVERRRENATLTVVGTPARVVATSEVGFAALPLLVGLTLATGAAAGMALALADLIDAQVPVTGAVLRTALWLGGGALISGLALVTLPALIPRRVTAEALRRP